MNDDSPTTYESHTAFRLIAQTGQFEERARILQTAFDNTTDPRFAGGVIVELLGIVDGLLEAHPQKERLQVIFEALSDVAELVTTHGQVWQ